MKIIRNLGWLALLIVALVLTTAATPRVVSMSARSDSLMRAGIDTLTKETAFCIKARDSWWTGRHIVDSVARATIISQSIGRVEYICPREFNSTAHTHLTRLDSAGYHYKGEPSAFDKWFALAHSRAPFSLIVVDSGGYYVYGTPAAPSAQEYQR